MYLKKRALSFIIENIDFTYNLLVRKTKDKETWNTLV
nr:MAG TPA: hypothetical protein [Caudoviricetes sp.]